MRVAILIILVAAAAFPASAATPPRLSLPYDIEVDPAGRLVIADGGKHQIYRWDARRKALVVIAGTGRAGATGDGGPARNARIDEIAGIALDRRGNLYLADVHYGTVRRIDRRGVITTLLRLPGAVGVAVDPAGRYLAVASIAKGVVRIELATGAQEPVVAVGEPGSRVRTVSPTTRAGTSGSPIQVGGSSASTRPPRRCSKSRTCRRAK